MTKEKKDDTPYSDVKIGALLQVMREQKGMGLNEVENEWEIPALYVKWLENQQYENFPNDVVARSLLERYSNKLDLNAKKVIKHSSIKNNDDDSKSQLNIVDIFLHWIIIYIMYFIVIYQMSTLIYQTTGV